MHGGADLAHPQPYVGRVGRAGPRRTGGAYALTGSAGAAAAQPQRRRGPAARPAAPLCRRAHVGRRPAHTAAQPPRPRSPHLLAVACTTPHHPPCPPPFRYCAPLYVDVTKTEYTRVGENEVEEKTETFSHVHLGKVRRQQQRGGSGAVAALGWRWRQDARMMARRTGWRGARGMCAAGWRRLCAVLPPNWRQ